MFDWPAVWAIVVSRLAPPALVGFPLVAALNDGLNASAEQF